MEDFDGMSLSLAEPTGAGDLFLSSWWSLCTSLAFFAVSVARGERSPSMELGGRGTGAGERLFLGVLRGEPFAGTRLGLELEGVCKLLESAGAFLASNAAVISPENSLQERVA